MKPKLYLFTFLLLLMRLANAQTYTVTLDSLVSVDFPEKPAVEQTKEGKLYTYQTDSRYYFVLIQDVHKKNKFAYITEGNLGLYYNNIINATVKEDHGILKNKRLFEIDNMRGIDFSYMSSQYADNTSTVFLPEYRFQHDLFLNDKLIACIYWTTADSANTAQDNIKRDAFLHSLKITASKANRKQHTDMQIGSKLGSIVRRMFVPLCIVLGLMITLIVVLAMVQRNKRKKQQTYNNERN